MTSGTQKFKFNKFLPHALSPTQNEPEEPKRSQIDPHLDDRTAVHILLEDAACRCFDLACTDLAHLSPNCATHLKSPKKDSPIFVCVTQRKSMQQIAQHEKELTLTEVLLCHNFFHLFAFITTKNITGATRGFIDTPPIIVQLISCVG